MVAEFGCHRYFGKRSPLNNRNIESELNSSSTTNVDRNESCAAIDGSANIFFPRHESRGVVVFPRLVTSLMVVVVILAS